MPSSFETIKKDGKVFVPVKDIEMAQSYDWDCCTHTLIIDKKTNLIKRVFLLDGSKQNTRCVLGREGYWGDSFVVKFNMTEEEEEEFDPTDYRLDGNDLVRIEK